MALDQQRNWTVSMEKNFDKIMRSTKAQGRQQDQIQSNVESRIEHDTTGTGSETPVWTRETVHLPDEIIIQILGYVSSFSQSQFTLASCCHLSHQWYSAAVPLLYRRPYLYGKNFDPFVRAICPSINLHVRESPLAELVKVLDMGSLVHQGSKSMTARLLGRTKGSLEEFVAPQASFAMNCFPALSKCRQLRSLDLSLVSESPPLPELFKSVQNLHKLKTFRLPRSAGFGANFDGTKISWPPHLEVLYLSGGIDAHIFRGMVSFPPTLSHLTIEHCPTIMTRQLLLLLRTAVRGLPNLEGLKIANVHRLHHNGLDTVLHILPDLRRLSVSVDYITPRFFDLKDTAFAKGYLVGAGLGDLEIDLISDETGVENRSALIAPQSQQAPGSNLRTLELTNSGKSDVEDKISPIDLLIAIQDQGVLPRLRKIRVARSLLWHAGEKANEAEALSSALGVNASEQSAADNTKDSEFETGVWAIDG